MHSDRAQPYDVTPLHWTVGRADTEHGSTEAAHRVAGQEKRLDQHGHTAGWHWHQAPSPCVVSSRPGGPAVGAQRHGRG